MASKLPAAIAAVYRAWKSCVAFSAFAVPSLDARSVYRSVTPEVIGQS